MKKIRDYLSSFGIGLTLIAMLDSFCVKSFHRQIHWIHKVRVKKVKSYLLNKYRNVFEKYNNYCSATACDENYNIWILWWQGLDQAPEVVKIAVESIKRNCGNHKIVVLSQNNIGNYITIPKEIQDNLDKGNMTFTFLSDYIRVKLLSLYGGLWLDSTIYLSKKIDDIYDGKSFFSVKHQKDEKWHICKGYWTGFCLGAPAGDPLMCLAEEVFRTYWDNEHMLIYYLLIDCVFSVAYDVCPNIKKEIDDIPNNNSNVFCLVNSLNEIYVKEKFAELTKQGISKLSWKNQYYEKKAGILTNYGYIKMEYLNFKEKR